MSVISMKQLLEAGVHFGHQTRRWNPKMAPYIYTERNGIYIIDLQKSVGKVDEAYKAVSDIAAAGGTILFVGTKKQAQDAIKTEAERCGMFYVNERWLGGMLTNFRTIQSRIARLKEIETMATDGTFEVLPKKEVIALKKELDNYRSSSKEAENQQLTAEITKTSYESLMTVISHYSTGDMSNSALAEELLKINSETLGASGKEEYDTLTGKIYPRVCESLYVTSQKNYQVANYDTAVTNLEQVVQMDEGYQDGAAMLLLAQSYEKQGKQDKANTYYQKIIEKYNGTEAATEAQNALDVQNAKKTKDNNN